MLKLFFVTKQGGRQLQSSAETNPAPVEEGQRGRGGTGGEMEDNNDKQTPGCRVRSFVSGGPFHLVLSKDLVQYSTKGQETDKKSCVCLPLEF